MLQLKTFQLPKEEKAANEFMAKQRPSGEINIINDRIFIFYEDGVFTSEHEIDELQKMLISNAMVAAHRALDIDDLKLAVRQIEALRDHRSVRQRERPRQRRAG